MVQNFCVYFHRAELKCAHHGWKAAVGERVQDEDYCGGRERLVENEERELRSLRFENLGSIGEEREWIWGVFDGWVGNGWRLKSGLEAVEEGLEICDGFL